MMKKAVKVGHQFSLIDEQDLRHIELENSNIILTVNDELYDLYIGKTLEDNQKLEQLFDSGKYEIKNLEYEKAKNLEVSVYKFLINHDLLKQDIINIEKRSLSYIIRLASFLNVTSFSTFFEIEKNKIEENEDNLEDFLNDYVENFYKKTEIKLRKEAETYIKKRQKEIYELKSEINAMENNIKTMDESLINRNQVSFL